MSSSDHDELVHQKLFIGSVNRGFADVGTGNMLSTDELKEPKEDLCGKRNERYLEQEAWN